MLVHRVLVVNVYDQNAIKIFVAKTIIPVGRMPKTCAKIVATYMEEGHIIGTSVCWKVVSSCGAR